MSKMPPDHRLDYIRTEDIPSAAERLKDALLYACERGQCDFYCEPGDCMYVGPEDVPV